MGRRNKKGQLCLEVSSLGNRLTCEKKVETAVGVTAIETDTVLRTIVAIIGAGREMQRKLGRCP